MDERTSVRIHGAAMRRLSFLILAILVACGPTKPVGPYVAYSSDSGEISCEIPSDWTIRKSEDFFLIISSPDDVAEFNAQIRISRGEKQTLKSLESERAGDLQRWKDDENFKQDPVKSIKFGEFSGLIYSYTTTNASAAGMRHRVAPPPSPVAYKETTIYFEGPGAQFYEIEYDAPTAIYDKHQPKLEHLLKTFRWTGGSTTQ